MWFPQDLYPTRPVPCQQAHVEASRDRFHLGTQRRHGSLEGHRVRAADLVNNPPSAVRVVDSLWLAVGEEDKCGHGRHAVAGRDVVDVVDIDFCERQLALEGVVVGELGEDGGDDTAGRAPVGVEVDDNVSVAGQYCVKLRGSRDLEDLA